ncbi:MAG: ATP-binding protein [Gammaproteobacteria bacterium]|jgi:serine/threonine-protein kinase RsbW|nr:ATP-binding protein [Gammaproteobacteria bacterium]MDH3561523.1 ATP-binding protein [Gammaproteobacteria bacterium]
MKTAILRIDSDARQVDAVISVLEEHCRASGLTEQETYQLTCAVVEGVNNVIEHAYNRQPGCPVELRWTQASNRINVEIRDWGDALAGEPDGAPPASDAEQGRGWFIMRQWLDAVDYQRDGDCNRLRLTRHLKP